jgi:gas vesicle protein
MARDDEGTSGAVVAAFVLGAVAGAALALLWAPTSGAETRKFLKDQAREGKDKAVEAAREGREFAQRQRENVSVAIDRGREAYRRAGERDQETAGDEV